MNDARDRSTAPEIYGSLSDSDKDRADQAARAFRDLYSIVIALRAPDGCPWDREQSPKTLRSNLVEEAFELVDAIDGNNPGEAREELGDVLLLVAMIARCFEEEASFSFHRVIRELSEKLIRRHPHVFGDSEAYDSGAVVKQWNEIKETVEGKPQRNGVLDGISRGLAPLERAYKLQKKAAKVGFDWPEVLDVVGKIREELGEVQQELDNGQKNDTSSDSLEAELGDLLFSVVNLCRFVRVDAALALNRTNNTFYQRFSSVERRMKDTGKSMGPDALDQMEQYWQEAKATPDDPG
jgi:tetrapyrrole methylase family protein/MazG family protein